MPDHTHPKYEQRLTRITAMLERLADSQVFVQDALGTLNDRTTKALDKLAE